MAVRIIVDSASDIMPSEAKELGMLHCPLKVLFGDKEYADSVDLTHKEFYEKLASGAFPTTSQVSPAEFEDAYREVVEAGDTAVVITISSKLSGTCQSANIAADDYEGKVFVVDSENAALGERMLAFRALEYVKEGLSAAEIADRLNEDKKSLKLFARLDTLEYLKKGGRISAAAAVAGSVLSIKPVISVINGKVESVGKARGVKGANKLLRELVDQTNGINTDMPFTFAFSGEEREVAEKFAEAHVDMWDGEGKEVPMCSVGCVIGTHTGPGVVAVAYFEK